MRHAKRRIPRLLFPIALMALGAAITLLTLPLFPPQWVEVSQDGVRRLVGESLDLGYALNSMDSGPPEHSGNTVPTLRISPTQQPTPTSLPKPNDRATLNDRRVYLLELINKDRGSLGLPPVELGSNAAAQEHAEEMLENSYLSHWGLDGLTPYMRYTLAGGVNYEGENVYGIASPLQSSSHYATITPKTELRRAQQGFMESPGHRTNILRPRHKKVNLGIACSRVTCAVVQQFEGDYIKFDELPTITAGILTLNAQLSDGFQFSSAQVWYDSPPHPLTLGQLARTYSYNTGETPIAFLRPPPPAGSYYPNNSDVFTWNYSLSPYDVSSDVPRLAAGYAIPRPPLIGKTQTNWITTDIWYVNGGTFNIKADLSEAVTEYGNGVYTVLIWGNAGDENVLLTKYSIFLVR